jgi:hypothetical protein
MPLIRESACKSPNLDKGFKGIVDEVKTTPSFLGSTQFPGKDPHQPHYSMTPLGRPSYLKMVIHRGGFEANTKVLEELYAIPPNAVGSVKLIGLALSPLPRRHIYHDPSFVQPYESFCF